MPRELFQFRQPQEFPISATIKEGSVGVAQHEPFDLISKYIEEQQRVTVVEKFARLHEESQIPSIQSRYRDLIPLSAPKPGQQYAFEVNLDDCTGCKSCVTACHSLNGLDADEQETWRQVGTLVGCESETPYTQTITTACHHCVEPGCLLGCPVKAYDKDPLTGIVKHLDDQCIGCQYCVFMCPYDVPQFSPSRGIVRKCDMCSNRLAVQEAPACVQGCPNDAIQITIVDQQAAKTAPEQFLNLPEVPDSKHTFPTTRYVSQKPMPTSARPSDADRPKVEHSHTPLVIMLVMTQWAVGMLLISGVCQWLVSGLSTGFALAGAAGSLVVCSIALGVSLMHLGRPQFAFRAFLGLRTSWLSREILGFGAFASLLGGLTLLVGLSALPEELDLPQQIQAAVNLAETQLPFLWVGVILVGAVSVFFSGKIYQVAPRPTWHHPFTLVRFGTTPLLLGILSALVLLQWFPNQSTLLEMGLLLGLGLCFAVKLITEFGLVFSSDQERKNTWKKATQLMATHLKPTLVLRLGCGILGALLIPWLMLAFESGTFSQLLGLSALGTLFVGELMERRLFFMASIGRTMPGSA